MEIHKAIMGYEAQMPRHRGTLSRISLSLRRTNVGTVAQLRELYQTNPDALMNIRGIGVRSMTVIGEMLQFYEAKAPPGKVENIHSYESGRNILSSIR